MSKARSLVNAINSGKNFRCYKIYESENDDLLQKSIDYCEEAFDIIKQYPQKLFDENNGSSKYINNYYNKIYKNIAFLKSLMNSIEEVIKYETQLTSARKENNQSRVKFLQDEYGGVYNELEDSLNVLKNSINSIFS